MQPKTAINSKMVIQSRKPSPPIGCLLKGALFCQSRCFWILSVQWIKTLQNKRNPITCRRFYLWVAMEKVLMDRRCGCTMPIAYSFQLWITIWPNVSPKMLVHNVTESIWRCILHNIDSTLIPKGPRELKFGLFSHLGTNRRLTKYLHAYQHNL